MCVCVYLHCCSSVQTDCVVTGFAGQTSREATHTLQPVPDIRQEAAQRPLQVDPRAALHRLQTDAAQRVAAQEEVKGAFCRFHNIDHVQGITLLRIYKA